MIAIEAEGLTKVYRNAVTAVDHIDLKVNEGEIFGFLGPNGTGKTTTIKLLTTLVRPTKGYARVLGQDVVKNADHVRRLIGTVPQGLSVDDDLTGMSNLILSSKLYHVPSNVAKKRVKELLEMVGLTDAAQRNVETYSGGMRKRLELIVGLIHQPKILFLDEPTLGLDVQTRSIMWKYIKSLNTNHGITIFLTTHYLEEADSLCDRVAIIDGGKIKVEGSPLQLKNTLGGDVIDLVVINADDSVVDMIRKNNFVRQIDVNNTHYRIKVAKGEESLPLLLEQLNRSGKQVHSVSLKKPTLDEVFLEHTGKSLRDADEGSDDARKQIYMTRRMRR